jgi:hypothetical protein
MATAKSSTAAKSVASKRVASAQQKAIAKASIERKVSKGRSTVPSVSTVPQDAEPKWVRLGLHPTDVPGVFTNRVGIRVDENGVSMSFNALQHAARSRDEEVIGEAADTPAKMLKVAALDPRNPLDMRIDAAKAAAPYFDKKQPTSIEATVSGTITIKPETILAALSNKELAALEVVLAKLGKVIDAEVKAEGALDAS